MRFFRNIASSPRRFLKNDRGNASIEFLFIFPVFITIFLSVFEAGVLMTKYMMLERAVDMAVRDVRLSDGTGITHATLVSDICENAYIFKNCESTLLLELQPIPMDGTLVLDAISCIDRIEDVTPLVKFTPGAASEVMLVRACVIVDPMFPGTGLGLQLSKDASGGYAMRTASAFVNEPTS